MCPSLTFRVTVCPCAKRVSRPAGFGGEQATIEFWQTKRDGGKRGIIEIVEKADDQERH